MEIVLIIGLIVAVFGVVGWLSMHKAKQAVFWTVLGGIGLLSGYWALQMIEATGYDGLTYLILLALGSVPAGISLLLGAGIGLLTGKRGTGLGAIPS